MEWERRVQNNSKVLVGTTARRDFLFTEMGKSYGLELSSGPGKLQMPTKSQEELSKAASLQRQELRGEAQAWMGLEWGRVGIICRS